MCKYDLKVMLKWNYKIMLKTADMKKKEIDVWPRGMNFSGKMVDYKIIRFHSARRFSTRGANLKQIWDLVASTRLTLPASIEIPDWSDETQAVFDTDSWKVTTSSERTSPEQNVIPSVRILPQKEAIITTHDQPLSISGVKLKSSLSFSSSSSAVELQWSSEETSIS